MKKFYLSIVAIAAIGSIASGQVGINQNSPSATLDIVSPGTDATTKALEITNSAGTPKEIVTILDDGQVGLSTIAPPKATLDLGTGSPHTGTTERAQLAFSYGQSSGGFTHFIRTRHRSGTVGSSGNRIEFWLNDGGAFDTSTQPGTGNIDMLNITASGVGINSRPAPIQMLDVDGGIRFNGELELNNNVGTAGQVLTSAGTGNTPTWTNPSELNLEVRAALSADTGITNSATGGNNAFLAYQPLSFDSESTTTTEYNEATGTFTASEAGLYLITVNVESTFDSDGNEFAVGLRLLVNGTIKSEVAHRNTPFTRYRRQITTTLFLNASDAVTVQFGFPETFTDFNNLSAANSFLHIKKL